MTVKIVGAGFGRTGTLSLKLASQHQGFGPCYDLREVLLHPARMRDWLALANGAPRNWDRILAGSQSTMDWPSVAHRRELADAYPKAKVVLPDPAHRCWTGSGRADVTTASLPASERRL